MAKKKQGRFSRYIRPTTYLIDLSIINFLVIREILNNTPDEWLCLLISAIWIIISIFSRFYNIYRYTPEIKILNLLLVQFSLFLLAMFSVSGIFPLLEIAPKTNPAIYTICCACNRPDKVFHLLFYAKI